MDTRAKLIPTSVRIDYRPSASTPRPGSNCYTAELQMVIDTAGKPEPATVEVIRTNDRAFADVVLASVATWRFEAATLERAPVRQIVHEKRTIGSVTVVVPAGQRPSSANMPARPPSC